MKGRSGLPKGGPGMLKLHTVYLSSSLTQKICGLLSGLLCNPGAKERGLWGTIFWLRNAFDSRRPKCHWALWSESGDYGGHVIKVCQLRAVSQWVQLSPNHPVVIPVPGQGYSAAGRTLHCFSDLCSGSYYGRKTPWAKTRCPWTSVFCLYAGPSDSHGPISLCCVFSTDSGRLKTCVCLSYSQVLKNSGRYHLASIFSNSTEVSSASSPPPPRFRSVPRRQRKCWILSSPLTNLL